jgi:hypothetical protein
MKNDLEIPKRIQALPIDKKGRPVPWFVYWKDGEPDFRVVAPGKIALATLQRKCWVCGEKLGTYLAFVIGPMCAVNRVSSEPPSHRECAIFSAQACPFLTTPRMHRNEKDLPEDMTLYKNTAGFANPRNPGVALVWITNRFTPFNIQKPNPGVLFVLGDPLETLWYAEGREATRQEILHSIYGGLPTLLEVAKQDGPAAVDELTKKTREALLLVPKENAA